MENFNRDKFAKELNDARDLGEKGKKLAQDLKAEVNKTDEYLTSKDKHIQENIKDRADKIRQDVDKLRREEYPEIAREMDESVAPIHIPRKDLYELTELPPGVAKYLGESGYFEELPKLKKLSATQADYLTRQKNKGLSFGSLNDISEEVARYLSRAGELNLGGLTSMTDEVAKQLGEHEGELLLYGLSNISDIGIEYLSKHKGWMGLGVESLSDEAAVSLSKTNSKVSLDQLENISDAGALALSKIRPRVSAKIKEQFNKVTGGTYSDQESVE